ncbi:MAG: manganese efflux pump [Candidatus Thermoplasmatota archaeon]|nr:manganese efflux pump [Candidatus Thermoplasmatota archaeon]
MEILFILLVSIVLAVDAFVVSVACGMSHSRIDWRFCLKSSFFFGAAQALFFGTGFFLGYLIGSFISKAGPWVAFILLASIGAKMAWGSIRDRDRPRECRIISNRMLVMLSVATSIDALAVGITFPLLDMPVVVSVLIVGIITFMLSFIGVLLGGRLRGRFDRVAELIAGMILMGLGVKVLLDNLL